MFFKRISVVCTLLLIESSHSQSDSSKWVWGRSRSDRTRVVTGDRRYNGELVNPLFQANSNYNSDRPSANLYRYEVTEDSLTYDTYRPPRPTEQYRPKPESNRPVYPYRPEPEFVRPTNSLVENYRPTNRPHESTYYPNEYGYGSQSGDHSLQGLRPGIGTNGRPILTGPVPSWEDDGHHKYKDYDICKCVHSFNCNSPGIRFGTCDTDKQYCCYKSKKGEGYGRPVTSVYERPHPRPVLAGPGGPVDVPGRPYQDRLQPPPLQPQSTRRPYRPVEDRDRELKELDEAYKKGLASTLYKYETRPETYYDRERQDNRDFYYPYDRESYLTSGNFKSSNPSKYGLYDPASTSVYARTKNSTISSSL